LRTSEIKYIILAPLNVEPLCVEHTSKLSHKCTLHTMFESAGGIMRMCGS